MDELTDKEKIVELTSELNRWRTAFKTENLALAIIERERIMQLLNELCASLPPNSPFLNQAKEYGFIP